MAGQCPLAPSSQPALLRSRTIGSVRCHCRSSRRCTARALRIHEGSRSRVCKLPGRDFNRLSSAAQSLRDDHGPQGSDFKKGCGFRSHLRTEHESGDDDEGIGARASTPQEHVGGFHGEEAAEEVASSKARDECGHQRRAGPGRTGDLRHIGAKHGAAADDDNLDTMGLEPTTCERTKRRVDSRRGENGCPGLGPSSVHPNEEDGPCFGCEDHLAEGKVE